MINFNTQEKREFDDLQKQMDAIAIKKREFEAKIDLVRQEIEQLAADKKTAMKALPNTENPLAEYRKVAKIQDEINLRELFIKDAAGVLPRILGDMEPLRSKQSAIDRKATDRARELRHFQEQITKYGPSGLGAESRANFERLKAEQSA